MDKNWQEKFFKKYYLDFVANRKTHADTKSEVDFVLNILGSGKANKILDLACGTGRHAIELAKNGYNVVGIDFHDDSLKIAKKLSVKNSITPFFVQSDMRKIPFKNEFDIVLSMFTSFGYFESDKENDRVLKEVARALKSGGVFLLDLQNKKWMLKNVPRKSWDEINNFFILEKRNFDTKNKIFVNEIFILKANSAKKVERICTRVHLYELSEISKKLKESGLKVVKTFGDYDGSKFELSKSPRMIILARKA